MLLNEYNWPEAIHTYLVGGLSNAREAMEEGSSETAHVKGSSIVLLALAYLKLKSYFQTTICSPLLFSFPNTKCKRFKTYMVDLMRKEFHVLINVDDGGLDNNVAISKVGDQRRQEDNVMAEIVSINDRVAAMEEKLNTIYEPAKINAFFDVEFLHLKKRIDELEEKCVCEQKRQATINPAPVPLFKTKTFKRTKCHLPYRGK